MKKPSSTRPRKKRRTLEVSRRLDGRLATTRRSDIGFQFTDAYHSILSMSWARFIFWVFATYVFLNVFFAVGYYLCGPDALSSLSPDPLHRFMDVFFFSVQTLSTIGYGKITPVSLSVNILVTFESLFGLMGLALMTGILFSRFSRPTARVLFSEVALINFHDGVESLVFRMANERLNQIVEAQIHVVLVVDETTKEGERYRNFYDLTLERNRSPLFRFSWTIVHPITKESPLYKKSVDDLRETNAEIIVTVSGIDDTFSQTIYTRYSYTFNEILWDHRFVDMLKRTEHSFIVELDNIHSVVPLEPGSPN